MDFASRRVDLSEQVEEILAGTQSKSSFSDFPFLPAHELIGHPPFHSFSPGETPCQARSAGFHGPNGGGKGNRGRLRQHNQGNVTPLRTILSHMAHLSTILRIGLPTMSILDPTDRFQPSPCFPSIITRSPRGNSRKERAEGFSRQGPGNKRIF